MDESQISTNAVAAITIIGTLIVWTYTYIFYKAILKYNAISRSIKQRFDEYKLKQDKMILEASNEIREETFEYISKEIHDNITQTLSLAYINLNYNPSEEGIDKQLNKSKELISKALTDLNNLSKSLDSEIIKSHGLSSAIKFEIEKWSRVTNLKIDLTTGHIPLTLENNTELFVFRIVQESISNAVRYSKANSICIRLYTENQNLIVEIMDDGIGFDIQSVYKKKKIGQMSGLKNMRKRAEFLNGHMKLESLPGKGTTINIQIPTQYE